ncbi:TetR/AcrR family transcriptional regulator [Gimesia sp.]|uniref:TetR/AcrR family transcriptional regulator n=1 Tax=Gimesia sp. TaxID=2024833 RepID=UPI000C668647|nr:TetR/AcrR family transcriptional regulator [Gimesia sp.]MAX40675.1 TetR family transcriptional regulator [Gimesia sp.]HBL42074.1 TetR/AcrR family transcriptional regulator [Planctomycetaceae bacterium]|tara:strand:- start:6770 stop:7345 length:576 start_codon:yes stop_codon:yes gene_type:complete
MSKTQRPSNARKRIVETAEKLFYSEGIRAVGIDRVIAEAWVAKMTLYNHFPSKDDLVVEVLKYREEQFNLYLRQRMLEHQSQGLNSLKAFFAALKDWFQCSDYRGCAFLNALAELADSNPTATDFCSDHKRRFKEQLTEIIIESAGTQAAAVAPAICILVEGAIVTAVSEGNADAAGIAEQAAEILISQTK